MTPAEHLAMAYPALASADASAVAWALAVAADYRPACLSEERQNLAQAHYAAHLLVQRAQSMVTGGVEVGAVTRMKEGDVEVTYGASSSSESGVPSTPYAAWRALADLCKRGAIVTRFG